jgi:hypothetical protein
MHLPQFSGYLKKPNVRGQQEAFHLQGCYDNAVAGSFFRLLKTEWVNHHRYLRRSEATRSLFYYIVIFYNRKRRHSVLDYETTQEYETFPLAVQLRVEQYQYRISEPMINVHYSENLPLKSDIAVGNHRKENSWQNYIPYGKNLQGGKS